VARSDCAPAGTGNPAILTRLASRTGGFASPSYDGFAETVFPDDRLWLGVARPQAVRSTALV